MAFAMSSMSLKFQSQYGLILVVAYPQSHDPIFLFQSQYGLILVFETYRDIIDPS